MIARVAAGLPIPDDAPPLLVAAAEVHRRSRPSTVGAWARLVAELYTAHDRLWTLGEPWHTRLDTLAELTFADLPRLVDRIDTQSWWIDGFAAPLVAILPLETLLPGFRLAEVGWARVDLPTTTDACWRALAEAGIGAPVAKCDEVDLALHEEPRVSFAELVRRATVALAVAGPAAAARLDPGAPVVVFADHGFRLSRDGDRWVHGGGSALERVVPVLRYVPDVGPT